MIKYRYQSNISDYIKGFIGSVLILNLVTVLNQKNLSLSYILGINGYFISLLILVFFLFLFIYMKVDVYEEKIELYYPFCFWRKKRLIINYIDVKSITIVAPFGRNPTRLDFYFNNKKKTIKKSGLINFSDEEIKTLTHFFKEKNIQFEFDRMGGIKRPTNW